MSKYFTSILFLLLLAGNVRAQDEEDEAPTKPVVKDSLHQLRFGVDLFHPILHSADDSRRSYEFEIDYYHRKELYFVAEGGWGSGKVNDSILSFSSTNTFFKAGINKGMLTRFASSDWDIGFVGARYGVAFIDRSKANYTIYDPFWGVLSGTKAAERFTAHWAEVNGGVRVELVKGLFTGWNMRGKFLLNKNRFKELPPSYIAGYGRGDKSSVFDFNFYLEYAIRWKMKKKPTTLPR
jgi:hypothetical protein